MKKFQKTLLVITILTLLTQKTYSITLSSEIKRITNSQINKFQLSLKEIWDSGDLKSTYFNNDEIFSQNYFLGDNFHRADYRDPNYEKLGVVSFGIFQQNSPFKNPKEVFYRIFLTDIELELTNETTGHPVFEKMDNHMQEEINTNNHHFIYKIKRCVIILENDNKSYSEIFGFGSDEQNFLDFFIRRPGDVANFIFAYKYTFNILNLRIQLPGLIFENGTYFYLQKPGNAKTVLCNEFKKDINLESYKELCGKLFAKDNRNGLELVTFLVNPVYDRVLI